MKKKKRSRLDKDCPSVFNRHHPDFLKGQVLNIVFGGFFGSRLMTNIREDKGYTYGIHSYLMANRHENGWMITTEAGRNVSEATIQEVHKGNEGIAGRTNT